ncbi:MAG: biotin-dependent carboxyltransferase family protein [Chitinophagaceae bacterium]|nr:biotin-dependent carboxyltransferase family protein [Chitinophagaceae bacterium]
MEGGCLQMSIQVIRAGIMDSLQDKGRFGFQQLGINPSGAMDLYSMEIANLLTGNAPDETVIEMHFPAPVLLFRSTALIALSGADFTAILNDEPIPLHQPVWVKKDDVLAFRSPRKGARLYMSVAGGFAIDQWLGSGSTNLVAAAGGFKGRTFAAADEIPFRKKWNDIQESKRVLPWKAGLDWGNESDKFSILLGKEWDWLTDSSKEQFFNQSYQLSTQSDRMGYRLEHPLLELKYQEELISSAVNRGTLQLLPNGKIILLMADHQTTGGYPRLGHVVSAHQHLLAQYRPGDSIYFRQVNQETAEQWIIRQQQHLLQLQNACTFRLQQYFHENNHQL